MHAPCPSARSRAARCIGNDCTTAAARGAFGSGQPTTHPRWATALSLCCHEAGCRVGAMSAWGVASPGWTACWVDRRDRGRLVLSHLVGVSAIAELTGVDHDDRPHRADHYSRAHDPLGARRRTDLFRVNARRRTEFDPVNGGTGQRLGRPVFTRADLCPTERTSARE